MNNLPNQSEQPGEVGHGQDAGWGAFAVGVYRPAVGRPVSTQLLMALREVILSGGLSAGDRLPASRTLAKDLGVSRTTVIEVYERLAGRGADRGPCRRRHPRRRRLECERPGAARPQAGAAERCGPGAGTAHRLKDVTGMIFRGGFRMSRGLSPTALPAYDAFPLAHGPGSRPSTGARPATR